MFSDQLSSFIRRPTPAYPQAQETLRRLRLGLHVDAWAAPTTRASLVLLGFSVAATALVALFAAAEWPALVVGGGLLAGVTSFQLRAKLVRLRGPQPTLTSRAISCFGLTLAMQLCVPALWSFFVLVQHCIALFR